MMKPARPRRLKIERHKILSRDQWLALRAGDITASVVGALFGLHPKESALGLFAAKTGVEMPEIEDTVAMRRGRLLEDAVAKAFLEEHPGWRVSKARVYLRAPVLRLGATPDFFVVDDKGRRGVLQAKTVQPVVFKKTWTDQTPPTWITLQCLTEMMLARVNLGIIAALVVDGYHFELHTYFVPRHPAAERRMQDAVAKFWEDLGSGRAPQIDFQHDGSLLPILYPHADPGKIVDLRGDNELPGLLDERERLKDEIAEKTTRKDEIETKLKFQMADAAAALVNGWRVTNKEQHRKEYTKTFEAIDYRVLRIAREHEKKEAAA